ncbi:MAG: monofunctional biosynthetic peptidoglycan transglycosylase [Nitrospiraceae bacterium]
MSKSNLRHTLISISVGFLFLLSLPLAGVGLYWLVTFPDVARLAKTNPRTTALMKTRMSQTREQGEPSRPQWNWVPLSQISPALQRAVIIAEDASFYDHEGFDWEGLREAVVRNLVAGKLERGGSTITQQLAKNLYLSSEKKLLRKAREALITSALEQYLTKKRILEIYLNVVEWGNDVYGAEAAARHHFGKSANDLTTDEAALLASILPAPRRHDPLEITPYLVKRQQHILRWMRKTDGDSQLSTTN